MKKSPRLGSLGQLAKAWEEGHQRHQSQIIPIREVGEAWAEIHPAHLTSAHISLLMDRWRNRLANATVRAYRTALHSFLLFVDEGYGTHHASKLPRAPKRIQRFTTWTDDEYTRILAVSPLWFRCFIMMCRLMALRHNEARLLTPRSWDIPSGKITIIRKHNAVSKIPVPDELVPMFATAYQQDIDAPIIKTLG